MPASDSLGMAEKSIELVSRCIATVSYTVYCIVYPVSYLVGAILYIPSKWTCNSALGIAVIQDLNSSRSEAMAS